MKKILLFFILIGVVFLGYYFWQSQSFNKQKLPEEVKTEIFKKQESKGPETKFFLEIDHPQNSSLVNNPTIVVSGKTLPDAEVFVNDQETKADSQGNFSLSINLDEGDNVLMVLANDKEGNFLEKELKVTLESLE